MDLASILLIFLVIFLSAAGVVLFALARSTYEIDKHEMDWRINENSAGVQENKESNELLQAYVMGEQAPPPRREIYNGESNSLAGVNSHVDLFISMTELFNKEELLNLIFLLDIPEDDLWSKDALPAHIIRESIKFMHRNGRMGDLRRTIKELRPHAGLR